MKASGKDAVIKVLSEEWPLTARQLHSRLQRQHSVSTSYQATHKLLKQMLTEGILEKKGKAYSIRVSWVESQQKNAEQLTKAVKQQTPEVNLESLKEGQSLTVNCKGIPETGWFLIDKILPAPNPEKKPGIALWRFCYSIVGLESKHLEGLKKAMKKNKWIVFIEEKNAVDKMFAETLKSYGFKEFHFGVKCATPLSDKMVLGDFISEITYPSWFRKVWAIQNRLPKKIIQFNLAKHFLLMREIQPNITITITKNKQQANEYRKEYLKGK
ncbi:MAG: hypothetical protein Q7R70_05530 [Candidatus Diapherotrites archaeon]|nr:hypothetical protein [Candidatus Diapherotrites archaeon]